MSFPGDDDDWSDAERGRSIMYRMMSYYICKLSYQCTWQRPLSVMNIANRAQVVNRFVRCNFTYMHKFKRGLAISWMSYNITPHPVAIEHVWLVKAPQCIRNVLDRQSWRCGCHCGIFSTLHTRLFVNITSQQSPSIKRRQWNHNLVTWRCINAKDR